MSLSDSFVRTPFARFINSTAGRIVRVAAGLLLMAWGYLHDQEAVGLVVMVLGGVPVLAGFQDYCLISALLGGPMRGARIREMVGK